MENWEIPGQTEFHYGIPANFQDFHIYNHSSVFDAYWLRQIYNGLLERQPGTHQWGNRLATSYTSSDGITWLIDINPNAKWADGTALTAYDVNYSYNLLIDPAFSTPDSTYWNSYLDITSINILNDYQVEITFLQPYVFQENNLAVDLMPEHIWGSIAPENHSSQAEYWANTDPTKLFGAGPYTLVNYDAIDHFIHLERNEYFDDWSGVTPNFEDIYFEYYANKEGALAALATGALDMVDELFSPQIDEIDSIPGVSYELVKDLSSEEIAVNMEHPYLGTGALCPIPRAESAKHIRKAISHMIPREVIVSEILDGLGLPGITAWSSGSVGFDDSLPHYEYSLSFALYEMEQAGFPITNGSPTPSNSTYITPTTLISGFAFTAIIGAIVLVGCLTIIVQYKKRQNN